MAFSTSSNLVSGWVYCNFRKSPVDTSPLVKTLQKSGECRVTCGHLDESSKGHGAAAVLRYIRMGSSEPAQQVSKEHPSTGALFLELCKLSKPCQSSASGAVVVWPRQQCSASCVDACVPTQEQRWWSVKSPLKTAIHTATSRRQAPFGKLLPSRYAGMV